MQDPSTGAINFNAPIRSDNGSIENDQISDIDGFSQAHVQGGQPGESVSRKKAKDRDPEREAKRQAKKDKKIKITELYDDTNANLGVSDGVLD